MQLFKTFLLLTGVALSMAASAQWLWTDKDGNKVFSDRAPPSDVPEKNILRRPGGSRPVVAAPAGAASAPTAAASMPQLKASDPALEARKRQADDAEAAQKKAEEARVAALRAENCTRARQAKASYDSGLRIGRTNAQGEREILDDATRAAEVKRVQDVIASDCR